MDCYSGEVMNAHRDAMTDHAYEVEEFRQNLIAHGARWYFVTGKERSGEQFTVETLAFSASEASKDALDNTTFVEIVSALTQEEIEAR